MTPFALPQNPDIEWVREERADMEWAGQCADCIRKLDVMISTSDAAELAGEMQSHRRWRDLVPAEAAMRLFAYSLSDSSLQAGRGAAGSIGLR